MTTKRQVIVVLLALSYLSLAVLGAACLFGVAPGSAVAHHHHAGSSGKAAHSPLCAWACQAGSSAILIGFVGFSFSLYVLFWSVASRISVFRQIAWATARPRSPPFASR